MGIREQFDTAKLFTSGGSQAVRLPKAFRFAGSEVRIRRDGDCVILEPVSADALPKTEADWAVLWEKLDALDAEPFPESLPQPLADPVDPW